MKEQTNNRIGIDNTGRFGIILPIVLISYFLILLNNSLVFTSTVQISRDMHMNSIMIAWVSNAYALTFGGFLSFGARLGDVLNRRTILLTGLWIFSIASLLVGLANNQVMLIAMRALQGIGGALLAPATLAIINGLLFRFNANKSNFVLWCNSGNWNKSWLNCWRDYCQLLYLAGWFLSRHDNGCYFDYFNLA